jgi:hypothetical protein
MLWGLARKLPNKLSTAQAGNAIQLFQTGDGHYVAVGSKVSGDIAWKRESPTYTSQHAALVALANGDNVFVSAGTGNVMAVEPSLSSTADSELPVATRVAVRRIDIDGEDRRWNLGAAAAALTSAAAASTIVRFGMRRSTPLALGSGVLAGAVVGAGMLGSAPARR